MRSFLLGYQTTSTKFTQIEVAKIVHKEYTDNIIHELNYKINDTKHWAAITYTNSKDSDESKEELTALLKPRESQIAVDVVGVLMEERFVEPGLTVFMIAAT